MTEKPGTKDPGRKNRAVKIRTEEPAGKPDRKNRKARAGDPGDARPPPQPDRKTDADRPCDPGLERFYSTKALPAA